VSNQEFAETILATLDRMAKEQGLLEDDGSPRSIPPVPSVPPEPDRRLPREREVGEDG
jgi:hypothetical protein